MNVTFLIGNGFDLGLGLKTKYSHFYETYLKDRDNDDNILRFKEDIASNIKNWSDFEKEFGKYSLECETADVYLTRFEDFVEKFNHYLRLEVYRANHWDEKKIFDSMTSGFENFYKNGKIVDEELLEKTLNKGSEKIIFNFITYNYTKCLDKCLEIIKSMITNDSWFSIGEIVHVHGYVDENMIMGVNDSDQIENKGFASLRAVQNEVVKPSENKAMKMNYDVNALRLINSSNIVCVYGMSLGDTDKKWWNAISHLIYNGSNKHLILFIDNDKYRKEFPHTWTKAINAAEERFLSFSTLNNSQKESIRDRIHYQINNHIFEMEFICKDPFEELLFGKLVTAQ